MGLSCPPVHEKALSKPFVEIRLDLIYFTGLVDRKVLSLRLALLFLLERRLELNLLFTEELRTVGLESAEALLNFLN